jgi:hypothetical protein
MGSGEIIMQIVFGKQTAEQLKEKYTVLELEPILTAQGTLEPYCVIPVEQIALRMSSINNDIDLHEKFVQAIKDNNTKLCVDLHEHLIGKFGGELDSFYEIVVQRCKDTGSTQLVLPEQS